ETRLAGSDLVEHGRCHDRADDLHNDVRDHVLAAEAPTEKQSDRDRGIEVRAGNTRTGIRHSDHGEAERQRHTRETNAQIRKSSSKHRAAATTQYQPESAEELGKKSFEHKSSPINENGKRSYVAYLSCNALRPLCIHACTSCRCVNVRVIPRQPP